MSRKDILASDIVRDSRQDINDNFIDLYQKVDTLSHNTLSDLDYGTSGHTGFGRIAHEAASAPTSNNDGIDTAGIGKSFRVGDFWVDSSTGAFYGCSDNSAGAAVWYDLTGSTIGFAQLDVANTFTEINTFSAGIKVDTISENVVGNGVTVDGVELKDGGGLFSGNVGIGEAANLYTFQISSGASTYATIRRNAGVGNDGYLRYGVDSVGTNFWSYAEDGSPRIHRFLVGNVGNPNLLTALTLESNGNATFAGNVEIGGNVSPTTDNTNDLGTSSLRWNDIYATNDVIQTSDERDKDRILDIPDSLSIIDSLRPVSFKWKDYTQIIEKTKMVPVEKTRIVEKDGEKFEETYTEQVEEKYTEEVEKTFKRTHYGLIAQEVEQSIIDKGINPDDFAPLIYNKQTDKYGLRYGEFIPMLIGSIKQLKQKVEELETEVAKFKG